MDDTSPDDTASLVDSYGDARVHLLRHGDKKGLGSAYKSGFSWALTQGRFSHLATMDGDGSHRAQDLSTLLKAAQKNDVALGTRWMPGGAIVNWPKARQWISKSGTSYARRALKSPFLDLTGGFRVYSIDAIKALNFAAIASQGYCFQIEMVRALQFAQRTFQEVPITFIERDSGKSKMSKRIVLEAFWRVSLWGVRARILPNADKLHYVK